MILGPDWTKNQVGLGKSATNFGQLVDRHGKKGSPVVPGSLQKVLEDGESVLYAVTVLRSMYEVRKQNSKRCAALLHRVVSAYYLKDSFYFLHASCLLILDNAFFTLS